jgi:hypothetical protein
MLKTIAVSSDDQTNLTKSLCLEQESSCSALNHDADTINTILRGHLF